MLGEDKKGAGGRSKTRKLLPTDMVLKEILFENIMYETNWEKYLIKIFMMISQTECNRINTVSV